jgi:voltage-gated potassium channel
MHDGGMGSGDTGQDTDHDTEQDTEQDTTDSGLKDPGFEIFIGALSILSIVNLVLIYAIDDTDLSNVLWVMNGVLSVVFIVDFFYRLVTADTKRTYLVHQLGWADLLASLPFPQVKVLRAFRLLRVVRLLRAYGARSIGRSLVADRAGSALMSMLLIGVLVLEFGSFSVLLLEKDVEGANITTASDALWWVVVTMSTVGYGDQFPVSNAGRILGGGVIVIGVGIFGTFTGFLANLFLAPRSTDTDDGTGEGADNDPDSESGGTTTHTSAIVTPTAAHDDETAQIDELRLLVIRQQQAIDEMARLLDRR